MYLQKPRSFSARDAALHLLSRRDHGIHELYQKLIFKGYEALEVEEVVQFCLEHKYLDDLRYARSQIRQHINKGHGEQRIKQELHQKKVAESIIEQAIECEPQDWFELAKQTAEKKFKGHRAVDRKEYAKQVRFMQYRGYTFDQISYALDF
ncbi:recombination regulator RecX [Vibrio parahaemolyticus]|uniref:recombination regulator RecX n=1 Tax=Vibrio parahaemolyticus TaxID=670 RepID=UPI0004B9AEC7|nr:recombination regulator RecX [Vibrio parahaemolyticus]